MLIQRRGNENGIALMTVLLLLILLSALGVGLMFLNATETQINSNFRQEQNAYFAARSGLEEVRDRMMTSNTANTISGILPKSSPTSAGGNILYVLNPGTGSASSINPWDNNDSKHFDTELCHDGYLGLSAPAADVPCSTAYGAGNFSGSNYTTSMLPWSTTNATTQFQWARVAIKLNNSLPNRSVNSSMGASNPVCWNGVYEQVLDTTKYASCSTASPSMNPVYLITSLAVTKGGARKMVQGEVGLSPAQPFPYGLFATCQSAACKKNPCSAIDLEGNMSTDSYDSSKGSYTSTKSDTGGDVGANGNVYTQGSVSIGGSVSSSLYSGKGSCPGSALTQTGNGGSVSGTIDSTPIATVTIPTPTIPNVTGPAVSNQSTLSPGNYGDVTIKNTTTKLSGGTYNVTSLVIASNGKLEVPSNAAVIINIVGTGTNAANPLQMGSNSQILNDSQVASNLQINYAGSGVLSLQGGSTAYMTIDAPNGEVDMNGGPALYGSIVADTIHDQGAVSFHYDLNTKNPNSGATYYSLISFRELYY
jgi:PilX N-terminal